MPARAARLVVPWLSFHLLLVANGSAQESHPTEYQIKAAFMFNFAKFVEWPVSALPQTNSPIVIGILGQTTFREDLEKTIRNKTVDEHPVVVREVQSIVDATNCHVLFISSSERARLQSIFQSLKGKSVLTVAEMDRFTESGGMIGFVLEGTKIRFRINNEAASGAGLKVSSKLLNLAQRS